MTLLHEHVDSHNLYSWVVIMNFVRDGFLMKSRK